MFDLRSLQLNSKAIFDTTTRLLVNGKERLDWRDTAIIGPAATRKRPSSTFVSSPKPFKVPKIKPGIMAVSDQTGTAQEEAKRRRDSAVKAAWERSLMAPEARMKQFRDLLSEKGISALSTWEEEEHKVALDQRYLLLTYRERKRVFDKYAREHAKGEREEKEILLKRKEEAFR